MSGPCASTVLSHIRVFDLTRVRSGPTCVRQVASWGEGDAIAANDRDCAEVALEAPTPRWSRRRCGTGEPVRNAQGRCVCPANKPV